jgi:hypothetical protein
MPLVARAPSLICNEFAAVITPSSLKADLSEAIFQGLYQSACPHPA